MPKRVSIPGYDKPIEFPDSMSQDDINAASKKLYQAKNPAPPSQKPSWWDKTKDYLDSEWQPFPDTPVEGNWFQQIGAAGENIEKLPLNVTRRAARGLIGLPGLVGQAYDNIMRGDANATLDMVDPGVMVKNSYEGMKQDTNELGPMAALGNLGGDVATMYLVGKGAEAAPEVAGKVTRPLSRILRKGNEGFVRAVTGTGPEALKDLVKKTEAENTAAAETRKDVVKKHFDKTHEDPTGTPIEGRSPTPDEQVSRGQAIERGVERSDTEIKDDLEKTYETEKDAANKPYNELKGALEHDKADPDKIALIIAEGAESMRGSETKPPILKGMVDRWEEMKNGTRDDEFNYDDLQGLREEIGRELRKGTLPPDVFDAYKKMIGKVDPDTGVMGGITGEMEAIARRADKREAQARGGKQLPKEQTYEGKLKAARPRYLQYAETFLDKDSPIYKALSSTERGEAVKAFQGKDQSGVERLAKYNPDLAKRINTVRGLQEEASKLPNEKPAKYEKPSELPPKQPPKKIGTEEARAHLTEKLANQAETTRKAGLRRALWVAGAGIPAEIVAAITGHPGAGAIAAVATPATAIAFSRMVANLLEKPSVIKWLGEPTAEQIAKIPPELRGNLKPIVEQAQKQGIKVSPALLAAIGYSAHPARPTPPALKGSPLDENEKKNPNKADQPPPGYVTVTKKGQMPHHIPQRNLAEAQRRGWSLVSQ